MRFVLLVAALFLLLGCTGSPPANQSGNQAPPPSPPPAPPGQVPPVQAPPAQPPPVPPEPPPVSGNITDNQTNQTSQTNPKGLPFGGGKYLLVLDDVSVIPNSAEPCGIFSLRNATDYSTYEKMFICPPESQEWTSPDNHIYRIKVIKVAAGYSGGGNWVDVIIYG